MPDNKWTQDLENAGRRVRVSDGGHVWMKFHKYAFMRFPPQDVSPVSRAEKRDLFLSVGALALSHHRLAEMGERANACLYLCSDKGYTLDRLSANNRSKVRRGLKRQDVRRVSEEEIAGKGYRCYADTCLRNGIRPIAEAEFRVKWSAGRNLGTRELWAVFSGNEMAATAVVWVCGRWCELFSTQSADAFLSDYPNHALFYGILREYLSRSSIDSVSCGLSSVQVQSKRESLHHFKLSVGFKAIDIVRVVEVHPVLRPVVNNVTLAGVRLAARRWSDSRHLKAALGALELALDAGRVGAREVT